MGAPSLSDLRSASAAHAERPRGNAGPAPAHTHAPRGWQRPRVEVICLACEISAYAPDGDGPLF